VYGICRSKSDQRTHAHTHRERERERERERRPIAAVSWSAVTVRITRDAVFTCSGGGGGQPIQVTGKNLVPEYRYTPHRHLILRRCAQPLSMDSSVELFVLLELAQLRLCWDICLATVRTLKLFYLGHCKKTHTQQTSREWSSCECPLTVS